MHHYLIMLLSTDWFLPFWSGIGLDLAQELKVAMQRGCREIVRAAIVKGAVDEDGAFDYIDWAEEAKLKAKSMLLELIDTVGVRRAAFDVFREWDTWNNDDVASTLMLNMLNHELIEGATTGTSPVLDFEIRVAVMESSVKEDTDPSLFEEIASKSMSEWDKYLQSVLQLDGMPTALTDHLPPAINMHRLRVQWNRVSERLTPEQRKELLSWYRQMAESRGLPFSAIPGFVGNSDVQRSA